MSNCCRAFAVFALKSVIGNNIQGNQYFLELKMWATWVRCFGWAPVNSYIGTVGTWLCFGLRLVALLSAPHCAPAAFALPAMSTAHCQHLFQNCVCAMNSCALVRTLLFAQMCRVCAVVGTNTTNIDCVAYFSLCLTQGVPEYRIDAVEVWSVPTKLLRV